MGASLSARPILVNRSGQARGIDIGWQIMPGSVFDVADFGSKLERFRLVALCGTEVVIERWAKGSMWRFAICFVVERDGGGDAKVRAVVNDTRAVDGKGIVGLR